MTERYICIHGHFYQPPRENPWLEDVELQDSAYPYHDWNEKITEECYMQNAASRILDRDKKIINIVNNYSKISFDFGPTLLYWLEKHARDVYEDIIEADRKSREIFSGHGAAIAQVYNHIIMPLANSRDKRTQVTWGIRDFEHRFGRKPEGMWLAEMAVDMETLELLAENGLKFTILAPHQAGRVRKIDSKSWKDVGRDGLDVTKPYQCKLASGRTINLFFYDGQISHDVAYGGLLHSGENFARRLAGVFSEKSEHAQLVHIATDGESYGHYHRHGDMALAYCLHYIESNNLAKITIYGEYLEKFPPNYEVEIKENTSWSCGHGIERWRSNCGCNYGRYPSGAQQWRGPLREAMDWLRDRLTPIYESKMKQYVADAWKARDEYISVLHDRSIENLGSFMSTLTGRELSFDEKVVFLKLLEMQRNALLMYTSCGWFFDDISGIEAVQVLQYADRTMQLAKEIGGEDFEAGFKNILEKASTNVKELADGKCVYEALIQPCGVDLNRVGAHLAISSLFEEYPKEIDIYCYKADIELYDRLEAGIQVLATGRATIRSNIVLEEYSVDFAVLHLGDHNLIGAVTGRLGDDKFFAMRRNLEKAFRKGDTTEVMRVMNISFEGNNYSLWHLFRDEQRRILYELLETTWQEIEASFRHIYEHNYTIIQVMRGMNIPLPKALSTPAEFILNQELCRVIDDEESRPEQLQALADEASRLSLQLDQATLRFEADHKINRLMEKLEGSPDDVNLLETIEATLRILGALISELDLQMAQNVFFAISRRKYPDMSKKADSGDELAKRWIEHFRNLGGYLGVRIL